jgi:hypothetical protein
VEKAEAELRALEGRGQPHQHRTGYDAAHAAAKKAVEEAYARCEQAST